MIVWELIARTVTTFTLFGVFETVRLIIKISVLTNCISSLRLIKYWQLQPWTLFGLFCRAQQLKNSSHGGNQVHGSNFIDICTFQDHLGISVHDYRFHYLQYAWYGSCWTYSNTNHWIKKIFCVSSSIKTLVIYIYLIKCICVFVKLHIFALPCYSYLYTLLSGLNPKIYL